MRYGFEVRKDWTYDIRLFIKDLSIIYNWKTNDSNQY